jgi:lipoprotein|uniref:Lipoprotein n=1 Tax=Inoviridae sp. ctFNB4 TaxID=2823614 RepID=A0A8S5LBK7_9VIRU|nr:MAG TPA: hypothetical protein [Inoviridae sp. ctFNB4]
MKKIIFALIAVIFACGFREYGAFKYEDSPFSQQRTEQFDDRFSKKIVEDLERQTPKKAKIERVGEQKRSGFRKLKGH